MTASDVNGGPGVIAISADNHWAHAYAGLNDVLLDEALETGPEVTFFDAEGHALRAVTDADGRLQALDHADAAADPEQVRDRLHVVLGRVPDVMRQHQKRIEQYLAEENVTLDQELAQLPSLEGADLAQTLQLYRTILGPHSMVEELQHRGSWFHNVFVHGW